MFLSCWIVHRKKVKSKNLETYVTVQSYSIGLLMLIYNRKLFTTLAQAWLFKK